MSVIFGNILIVVGAAVLGYGFLYAILRYRCWSEGRVW